MPDFGDRRVMACTTADIERWLHEFAGHAAVQRGPAKGPWPDAALESTAAGAMAGAGPDACFIIDAGDWRLRLSARQLAPRIIALLRMPQLEVAFDYEPDDASRARAWIAGFDRHTQRGGG